MTHKLSENKMKASCFFVTPIGDDGSPDRKRADNMLDLVLKPAVGDLVDIVRVDRLDEPGTITNEIVKRLYEADVVIADITGHNPNVMWEMGVRDALNKPMVRISQKGEKIPFDQFAENTVRFDINDLSEVDSAKNKIRKQCEFALSQSKSPHFRSPVVRILESEGAAYQVKKIPEQVELVEKVERLESMIEDLPGEIQSELSFWNTFERDENGLSEVTVNRVEELARLFDCIGPSDIMRLAEAIKSLK